MKLIGVEPVDTRHSKGLYNIGTLFLYQKTIFIIPGLYEKIFLELELHFSTYLR
jgi:hypothetical protein